MRALHVVHGIVLLVVLSADAEASARSRTHDIRAHEMLRWTVWSNVTVDGLDADGVRAEADGNGDGAVSDAERAAYEAFVLERAQGQLTSPQIRLDGSAPAAQSAFHVAFRGLVGPVAGGRPVEFDLGIRVEFAAEGSGPLHAIGRSARSSDAGHVNVTVPPRMYALDGRGIDDYRLSADERTVSGRNDGASAIEVRFLPHGSTAPPSSTAAPAPVTNDDKGIHIPAPGAALALALVGAVVFIRRR